MISRLLADPRRQITIAGLEKLQILAKHETFPVGSDSDGRTFPTLMSSWKHFTYRSFHGIKLPPETQFQT